MTDTLWGLASIRRALEFYNLLQKKFFLVTLQLVLNMLPSNNFLQNVRRINFEGSQTFGRIFATEYDRKTTCSAAGATASLCLSWWIEHTLI